jgi:hypothetical protein
MDAKDACDFLNFANPPYLIWVINLSSVKCWDLCINLKYNNKSGSKRYKRDKNWITGGSVLNIYIHHFEWALCLHCVSLTCFSTININISIYKAGLE